MELAQMVTQDMSKDSYLRHFLQFSVDVKRCSETKIENSFVIMEPKDEDLTALHTQMSDLVSVSVRLQSECLSRHCIHLPAEDHGRLAAR